MIKQLFITNYILIKSLEFEVKEGLSVITGETGAGKSIFINALNLLSGQRLSNAIVGPFGDSALIEGIFDFNHQPDKQKQLQEAGFELQEEHVFSRTINTAGKSVYRIDRQIVPLNLVKSLLDSEIDIHSQFNTQNILNHQKQLGFLDQYAHHEELLYLVHQMYDLYKQSIKDKEDLISNELSEYEVHQLQEQVQLLESYKLSLDEYQELVSQAEQFKDYETFLHQAQTIQNTLEDVNYQALYSVKDNSGLKELDELLSNAYFSLEEADHLISKTLAKQSQLLETLDEVNDRLYIYQQAQRKFKKDLPELIQYIEDSKVRINNSLSLKDTLLEMDRIISKNYEAYITQAKKLSTSRQKASKKLSQEILAHTSDLNMNNMQFDVNFLQVETRDGIDKVEFLVSMNKGQKPGPIEQVASGGELSRLMLILKIIFNQNESPKLIVLDEIDTGVSGTVARLMGEKMYQLSKHHCVLTVTHLPIVAAFGDRHFKVIKEDATDSTLVHFTTLDKEASNQELALMMASNVNQSTLANVSELRLEIENFKDGL